MSCSIRYTLAAVVLGASLAPSSAPAQGDPPDWPTYNHDGLGTRYNPAERTLGRENVGRLVEKWRCPAQGPELQIGVIHTTPRRRSLTGPCTSAPSRWTRPSPS